MNKWIGMGRLTKDPVIRMSADGNTTIGAFTIAVDRRFAKKDDEITTDYFDCTCFGKLAEFAERYLFKGTKVVLSGELQNNNYTTKDGSKVYSVKIIVNEVEFAESKKKDELKDGVPTEGELFTPAEMDNLPFK